MSNEEKQYDEAGRVVRENRALDKREREQTKQFAAELLKLPAHQYPLLPIDNTLKDALMLGKRLSNNALKRHMNYLTRLIIEQDEQVIKKAHEHINHPYLNNSAKMQQIEAEIKRLITGDEQILADLLEKYAEFDVQYVRQLTREIHKHLALQVLVDETDRNSKPSKHQRKLRQYLQSLTLYYDPNEDDTSAVSHHES